MERSRSRSHHGQKFFWEGGTEGGGKRRSAKQQSVAMLPGAPGSEKTSFSTFTNHNYLFLLFPD